MKEASALWQSLRGEAISVIEGVTVGKWASQVASVVKNLPASAGDLRDMGSLGHEDPLWGTTTHSSILAWRIPWTGEAGRLWSIGSQRIGHNGSDFAQHSTIG